MTELIPEPVESTQRMEQAPVAAPYGGEQPPPGPPDRYDDDRDKRRSPLVPILVGLAVLGIIALVYLLNQPSGTGNDAAQTPPTQTTTAPAVTKTSSSSTSKTSSSSSTSTTTTPTTSTTTTKAPDNEGLAKFIKSYYSDVTKKNKRDDTFAQLTPEYQAKMGGRDAYEQFWSTIDSVEVGETQADAGVGTVIVQLTFKKQDGGDSQEVHRITVEPKGGSWLISGDGQA